MVFRVFLRGSRTPFVHRETRYMSVLVLASAKPENTEMESPMRACVVHSQDVDSVDAVAELIAAAKVALGAAVPRVAMLFAGIDHDFGIVLEEINAQWPNIALIG